MGVWLLLFFSLLCTPYTSHARALYTISINVDEQSKSADAAKNIALEHGRQEAWRQLIHQMTSHTEWHKLVPLDSKELLNLVDNFSIQKEKASKVRYLAELTFAFNPQKVQRLLRQKNISFSDTLPPPVMVLPLLQENGQLYLWDSSNYWFGLWKACNQKPGRLMSFLLPMGDLVDQNQLPVEALLKGEVSKLKALGARYGVEHFIVVVMPPALQEREPMPAADAHTIPQPITTDIFISPLLFNDLRQQTLHIESTNTPQDFAQQLPEAILSRLEEQWKARHRSDDFSLNTLALSVSVNNLSSLLSALKKLENIGGVEAVDLKSFSRQWAHIDVRFYGRKETFVSQVEKQGISFQYMAKNDV